MADTARFTVGRVRHAGSRAVPAPSGTEPAFRRGLLHGVRPVQRRRPSERADRRESAARRGAPGAHASPRAATDRGGTSARSERRGASKRGDADPRTRRPTNGRHGAIHGRSSAAREPACGPGALRRGAGFPSRASARREAGTAAPSVGARRPPGIRRPSGRAGHPPSVGARRERTRPRVPQQTDAEGPSAATADTPQTDAERPRAANVDPPPAEAESPRAANGATPRSAATRNRARGDRLTADTARFTVGRVRHAGSRAVPAPSGAEPAFRRGLLHVVGPELRRRPTGRADRRESAARRGAPGAHASPRAATDRGGTSARCERCDTSKRRDAEPRARRPTHGRHGAIHGQSSAARGLACGPGALRHGAGFPSRAFARRRCGTAAPSDGTRKPPGIRCPSGRAGSAREPACRHRPRRKVRAQRTSPRLEVQRRATAHAASASRPTRRGSRSVECGTRARVRSRRPPARSRLSVAGLYTAPSTSRPRSPAPRERRCCSCATTRSRTSGTNCAPARPGRRSRPRG
jgi:hypothetical protein